MRLQGASKRNLTLLAALVGAGLTVSAAAQTAQSDATTTASKADKVIDYRISSQPLANALRQFAEVTGLPLVYDAKIAAGKQSGEVSGPMNANAALTRMLAGSGLAFTLSANGSVLLSTGASSGALALGVVRVDGGNLDGGKATVANGVNGSTDVQATEGTGSYTTNATSIATKSVQTLKDTPFAVSVITRQRLDDQSLTNLTAALDQMTGVTTTYGSDTTQRNIYSRGFAISSYSIDGGSPLHGATQSTGNTSFLPALDLSVYDSVQLERGAAGIFNGYGDPGGVLNLVRKKPLDHNQVQIEGQVGSWENYRTSIDATGPIGFDGKLRARAVVTEQDNHFFYARAKNNLSLLYGVLEADLTSTTRLTGGLNVSRNNASPCAEGLPRYTNGDDLGLPTSTCLTYPWSRADSTNTQWFAQLDQKLGSHWTLTAHLTKDRTATEAKEGYSLGGVNNVTQQGPQAYFSQNQSAFTQTAADATLNGAFDWLGRRQEIVFGANWQIVRSRYSFIFDTPVTDPATAIDVRNFDPSLPEPASVPPLLSFDPDGSRQSGAYVSVNLNPLENLHVLTSLRYSRYTSSTTSSFLCQFASDGCVVGASLFSAINTNTDHNFSKPNLSVSYDLGKSLSVFGTYATIYFPQGTNLTAAGAPLPPVKGYNTEFGAKWASPEKDLNASLTAYRVVQTGVATLDPNASQDIPNCCFLPGGGRSDSKGVDAELTGQVKKNWQMSFGYTFNVNSTVDPANSFSNGKPLITEQPRHVLKLFTTYRLIQGDDWLQRVTFGGGVNWQSRAFTAGRYCTTFDPKTGECTVPQIPFSYDVKSYALVQAFLDYRLDDHWHVSLNGTNLTNHVAYQTISGNPGNGNYYVQPAAYTLTLRGKW